MFRISSIAFLIAVAQALMPAVSRLVSTPEGPRKNNCMIAGVTQSMSCTISLLSRGFHILPTAYKQSCSILL